MALCNLFSILCNDFFKTQRSIFDYLFIWLSYVKNVDELESEHHVQTHINESPCLIINTGMPSKSDKIFVS